MYYLRCSQYLTHFNHYDFPTQVQNQHYIHCFDSFHLANWYFHWYSYCYCEIGHHSAWVCQWSWCLSWMRFVFDRCVLFSLGKLLWCWCLCQLVRVVVVRFVSRLLAVGWSLHIVRVGFEMFHRFFVGPRDWWGSSSWIVMSLSWRSLWISGF